MKEKLKLLLVGETIQGTFNESSLELLNLAVALREGIPVEPTFVVPGSETAQRAAEIAKTAGITVISLHGENLNNTSPDSMVQAMKEISSELQPHIICMLHSTRGSHLAPLVAHAMGAPAVSSVESVHVTGDRVIAVRSLYNGKLKQELPLDAFPVVLSVQPGAFAGIDMQNFQGGGREPVTREVIGSDTWYHLEGLVPVEPEAGQKIEDAEVIIAGGRGLGKEENLELLDKLAKCFPRSAVAASRPVVDSGWLPYSRQVGATGKTVSPGLYLACGISGASQHLMGMKGSRLVVAVNTDPNAAIFSVADYCIVEDCTTFVP
ncbi:MAG: electron transfer flavoprotein subunit alpha/FixB family protein, partial [Spirochaetota bacterium]